MGNTDGQIARTWSPFQAPYLREFVGQSRRCLLGTPWAWGVNGSFSVLAPVIAVAVSTTWGISVLLVLAALVYLVAGFSLPRAVHRAHL